MGTDNGRFRWWQKIAIDQLGYSLHLFLGLSIAALGYWFSLLREDRFTPSTTARCALLVALASLALAVSFGLLCVLTRLYDFRWTAQRANDNPAAPSQDHLRRVGRLGRGLFYLQVLAFAVGILALATALLLTYGGKLI